MHVLFLLLAAASGETGTDDNVVITASREPVAQSDAGASVSVTDGDTLDTLALPLTADALRLQPSVSITSVGTPGSQVQLRIRGSEANHSLLYVDGIRFNDPAAGNEARFELLTNDAVSRLEVIRGPQSALWGSEALGGVIAVESTDPQADSPLSARAEYGSHDSVRLSGKGGYQSGPFAISAAAGWLRSDGIDAFGGNGDRDGFDNVSASVKTVYAFGPATEIGAVGHWIEAKNDYDGLDQTTFFRGDTLDTTDNRILAGRLWLKSKFGAEESWSLLVDGSLLGSRNRNELDGDLLNTTWGERGTASAQLSKTLAIGSTNHRFTAAGEYQHETFKARDVILGSANQDQKRDMGAAIGEWRAQWLPELSTDLALRHDWFSEFAGATTVRANVSLRPAEGWTLHAAYGEGIAQPTFFDLFGFFPGQFTGNPDLRAERGSSLEAGVRWANAATSLGATVYRARLKDEIVQVFFPNSTAINATGTSKRWGIELEAAQQLDDRFTIQANYSYLDAEEPSTGGAPIREIRRPKHSANLIATAKLDPVEIGASLAYVGKRGDTNFDVFPSEDVVLGAYLLASLNVAVNLGKGVQAYARMENAFDEDYQDAVGYATLGRTVYAGLRLRLGD